jgi:glycosyltransferase involved in cell wall biosynthesis
MKLIALVESPRHVCCRYRLTAFADRLTRAGHSLSLVAWPRSTWQRLRLFLRLRGENVILQRYLLPGWQLSLLRMSVKRLIFDFDDAVWLRDSYSWRSMHNSRRLRRFVRTLRNCDAVVAGNSWLREEASQWTDPDNVALIPTCVDPEPYRVSNAERTSRFAQVGSTNGRTLAWIGSSSTLQGIERIAPLLEQLGQRLEGLRLKVICDRFPQFKNLEVIRCPWSEATEASDLLSCDVGINWLPDDPWSRGKCGLKILQYMAARLPVVANPVGVQREMIQHGRTGFLAHSSDEWYSAILQLIENASLRSRMGTAGQRLFRERYSVAQGAEAWLDVLAKLENTRRVFVEEESIGATAAPTVAPAPLQQGVKAR